VPELRGDVYEEAGAADLLQPVLRQQDGVGEKDVGVTGEGPRGWAALSDEEVDAGIIIPRVATGVSNRVGRLRALGNGQVPLCAAVAFCYLYALAYRTDDDREEP